MTVEQEALDLETEASLLLQGSPARKGVPLVREHTTAHAIQALCRALEQRDANVLRADKAESDLAAFKADVSEEVSKAIDLLETWVGNSDEAGKRAADPLRRFILPTPDPLVEALAEADAPQLGPDGYTHMAQRLRDAASRRGYTLKLERLDQ